MGDLRDAEADIRAALTVGREHSNSSREPVLLATLVAALVDAAQLDEADAELITRPPSPELGGSLARNPPSLRSCASQTGAGTEGRGTCRAPCLR